MSKGHEIAAEAVELANQAVSPPHLIVTLIITAINLLITVLTNREGADSRVG